MTTAPQSTAGLEAVGLTRRFGALTAVDNLSLSVEPGELYGLVGPDGAGKTTTIRMLTGLIIPDGGEARAVGERVVDGSRRVREAIGYMPQQYSLYGDLSVDENLKFFGHLFGLRRKELRERRDRLLGLTRLDRFGDRRADALSGGMYKKLALACALLHRPRVLVLDEPTNGVDPVSRRELWDLLYEFVGEGMAVLLATPYMDEASRCHRVGLLHRGALLAEGEPKQLTRAFVHDTLLLETRDRTTAEDRLHDHPDVLALSPHGSALRVVVRRSGAGAFRAWAAQSAEITSVQPIAPDFEDVFLGLLEDPESIARGGSA